MEYCWNSVHFFELAGYKCLNPYSNGIPLELVQDGNLYTNNSCLNPYSNGIALEPGLPR